MPRESRLPDPPLILSLVWISVSYLFVMRVALVHDYLNQYGGAERVLEAFCEIWPQAPIFTLFYDEKRTGRAFCGRRVRTSFLQKIPFVKARHRSFMMLMPLAIEQFDLSAYDLVISDSASFAKGIITGPQTLHVCYCHTPTRYIWDDSHKYLEEFGWPSWVKKIAPFFISYLRLWDAAAAGRVDYFIANSHFVASRVRKYYGRDCRVIYPPVNVSSFYLVKEPADYFLIVARFLPYKKIDLAIEVFNQLGWKLKIIGDGPDRKRLKRMARPNVEFVGLVAEKELKDYYARCQALVFPQEEDFGLVAVEAMAAGRPVVAYRAGGALEIVKEDENGVFFNQQTAASLREALQKVRQQKFDPEAIRRRAFLFDKTVFQNQIKEYVSQLMDGRII